MEIERKIEDGKTVYRVVGRVDTQTAPDLQAALDKGFEDGDKNLVLDFENVEYLSSAGLRTVLYAQKRINTMENGKMVVINVKPSVLEVFDMTGFTDFIKVNPEESDI